ncbi:YbaB/EbfC family nucleoid-associated protein [Actinoplanes sp. CA-015351]|uniref:YbaB/EbfC family nucleoid-associated protein n=1 Tax=Actinoplanes sp. CA-015351 TaxID=3239897 RepID=UPI003D956671
MTETLRTDLEDVYGRYEELRSGVDELQRSIATMQVSSESEDGAVRATVDADGRLINLTLNPDAYREWDANTLARVIVQTVQNASADKYDQIENLVTNHRPAETEA